MSNVKLFHQGDSEKDFLLVLVGPSDYQHVFFGLLDRSVLVVEGGGNMPLNVPGL